MNQIYSLRVIDVLSGLFLRPDAVIALVLFLLLV